jgi:formamidopyrimidine-DNA glycosylase
MPEISEVAVYAKDLNKITENKKLTSVSFCGESRWREKIVPLPARKLLSSFIGNLCKFESRGKSLYFSTSGAENNILFKLGMTGMFQLELPKPDSKDRHAFLILEFEDLIVYYLDYRRFGRITTTVEKETIALAGYEDRFFSLSRKEIKLFLPSLNGQLKKPKISWLLDHGARTGVGNYLANEALGSLNLDPFTPCKDSEEALNLLLEVIKVAKLSFKKGGNSFKGGYYRLTGEKGTFYKYCRYYRNENVPYSVFNGRPVYSYYSQPPKA